MVWIHAVSDRLLCVLARDSYDDIYGTNRSYAICPNYKIGVYFRAVFEVELDAIAQIDYALQCLLQVDDTRRHCFH